MSRKIPTKPFGANAEAKASETTPQKQTSPASATRKKAAAQAPVQVPTPAIVESTYKAGFQFILLLVIIALGGLAGYYGVPIVSQAINPTPVTRIDFNDTILNYEVGNTGRLGISVQGEYTRTDLKWVSSDFSIVDVDQGGNVFAKAPGTVIIQAFVGDGSIKDTIIINVSLPSE
jgi:uncharacterized protein YjdB